MSLRTGAEEMHQREPSAAVSEPAWTPASFRVANALGAAAAIALAGAILIASGEFAFRVRDLPGPAFFPVIIGVAMLALSVAWLVLALLGRVHPSEDTEAPPDRDALVRSSLALLVVLGSAFAMQPLGYPLTVAIAVTFLVLLARGRMRVALATGIAFAVLSFLLVTTALGVQLPTGVLRPLLVDLL